MKIKLYTIFTDSHKLFLDELIKFYPFKDGVDLTIRRVSQECETGEYNTKGFETTMKRKVEYIIDALHELQEGDLMVYADADIIFLKPFKDFIVKQMEGYDLGFQSDWGNVCMGFFACRVNSKTKDIFNKLLPELPNHPHDQDAINHLLRTTKFDLNIKLFPSEIYNYGFTGKHYHGEDNVVYPENIILLHANFAVGLNHKIKLIELAKKQFSL
jgi:hypothetical protein